MIVTAPVRVVQRGYGLPLAERLELGSEPEPMSGCVIWTRGNSGNVRGSAHGKLRVGNRDTFAHRAAWELAHGSIPRGQWVLHRCDNGLCINPRHLYLGTAHENNRDCRERGRHWSPFSAFREQNQCANGHEYTDANTRWWRGTRICRACGREKARRHYPDRLGYQLLYTAFRRMAARAMKEAS